MSAGVVALVALPAPARAHGESVRGVGGVGINTTGGEIASGASAYSRYDLRSYSLFTDAELLEFQKAGENVHQHSREHSAFLGATLGIAARWDLSALVQANRFEGFVDNGDAYALSNMTLSRTSVSQGLGDLLLLARYQVIHHHENHVAALVGVKLPTGDIRQRTDQGAIVGTHNQPGSGSVDFQLGTAYSAELGRHILIGADSILRINSEGAGSFRAGNSVQADVAIGVPVGSAFVPSLELNGFFQQQDIEQDLVKTNSGVYSVFVTPGARVSVGRHVLFGALSLPLWQEFPGISNDESVRIGVGYAFSFAVEGHGAPPPPPAERP